MTYSIRSLPLAALGLAWLVPPPVAGQAPPSPAPPSTSTVAVWRPDPAHSAVTFRVRHLGITWVNGTFRDWSAELNYDPAHPEASSVTARIQTASLDTRSERRDADLRANYLAVDSFPEIAFVSRRVEPDGLEALRVTGDLTIRGVTRPVVLEVEVGGVLATGRGRRAAFTATTAVRRQDYGITLNRLMEGAQIVGDQVRITIDVEAITSGAPPPTP